MIDALRVVVLFANAGLQIPAALFIVFISLIAHRPSEGLRGALVAVAALAGIGALLTLQRRWWLTVLCVVALIANVAVILTECYSWYDEALRSTTHTNHI